jgi:hypothetical protein
MISLLMVAALGQCQTQGYQRTYARSYAAPTYYYAQPAQQYYQQPAQQYYQQPAYNYSLVGDYMRQESAYQEAVKQNAKLDVLLKLLAERPAPQPPPAPAPQFQQPYATPQSPPKTTPQFELPPPAKPTPQYEAQPPYPTEQQPPPYPGKPSPSPPPVPSPSFESSSWVPPASASSGGGVAALTWVVQNRCVDCHVGTSEKGGGVKLLELDGQLADISPYLDDIGKDVTSGRMPKRGGRLSNQELYAVLAGLREYAATSRTRQSVLASFGQ